MTPSLPRRLAFPAVCVQLAPSPLLSTRVPSLGHSQHQRCQRQTGGVAQGERSAVPTLAATVLSGVLCEPLGRRSPSSLGGNDLPCARVKLSSGRWGLAQSPRWAWAETGSSQVCRLPCLSRPGRPSLGCEKAPASCSWHPPPPHPVPSDPPSRRAVTQGSARFHRDRVGSNHRCTPLGCFCGFSAVWVLTHL